MGRRLGTLILAACTACFPACAASPVDLDLQVFFIAQIVRAAQFQAANPGKALVIGPHNNALGHWSPATANVDWCGANYVYTYCVAEFWNALPSGLFVVVAVVGGWQTRKLGMRHVIPFLSLAVVGLGSMCFHATLSRVGQDLDEGPMACLGASLVFIGHFADKPRTMPRSLKAIMLMTCVIVVVVALIAFPEQNDIFLCLFIPSPVHATCRASTTYSVSNQAIRKQIRVAMAAAVISWLGWGIEPVICGSVFDKAQLHAWWHIGVCLGCFLCMHMSLNVEQTSHGNPTSLGALLPCTIVCNDVNNRGS